MDSEIRYGRAAGRCRPKEVREAIVTIMQRHVHILKRSVVRVIYFFYLIVWSLLKKHIVSR
jgi:hypothetical protein